MKALSKLDPQFLRAVVLMTSFKPERMKRVQASLLMIGLKGAEFTAADLPDELTEGSKHISGAATGSLVAIELLKVVGRVKSPEDRAKGRKLDLLRLASIRKAKSWLQANGFPVPDGEQIDGQQRLL